ncbi:MAG: serine/threonine protein kinase, partial [Pseudomonadota bacterium]|nr:serine/threonine protein kinase [Pseudomonadota bacterium]
ALAILVAALRRDREPPPAPTAALPELVLTPQPVVVPPVVDAPTSAATVAAASANGDAAAAEAKAAPRRKVEPVPVPVSPPRDGVVTLAVSPWGEVSVDGTPRGVSPPLTQLSLAPGVHTIEIRNGAAAPLVARIEVRAGETLGLQHRF